MSDFRVTNDNVTIASGDTVSGVVPLRSAVEIGIHAAALPASAQLFLQVGFAVASNAAFYRAWDPDAAANWSWDVGSVNAAVNIGAIASAFPFARIESSVAQTNTASFAILTKR